MLLKNAFEKSEFIGYKIPQYNRSQMINKTLSGVQWVHFGAGNIFRSFLAAACDEMLEQKCFETGIVLFETFDTQLIEKAYTAYNNIGINLTLCADASVEKSIIGSVAKASCNYEDMKAAFAAKSLMLASLTITEKGYITCDALGAFLPQVQKDIQNINDNPQNLMVKLTALLYHRFNTCKTPVALVSMDNFFHNSDKLRAAIEQIAVAAVDNSSFKRNFLAYLNNDVSFPCSMIDKITPRPDEQLALQLSNDGVQDVKIFVTDKHTYAACFVNAEKTQYLVIEDNFKNGRPPFEKAGIFLTDRKTVDSAEKMKVCTCLNPLHTALAVFGCLLQYNKISDEMQDPLLCSLVTKLAYDEGLPVCANPIVIKPEQFLQEVLQNRLTNPFMPDTPQRIACDTSQKLSVRFGETIKNYPKDKRKDLTIIMLVIAGWLRYLMAIDDDNNAFELSPDPLLPRLTIIMQQFAIGKNANTSALDEILSDDIIFGVNLLQDGMDKKIKDIFCQMIKEKGSVKQTLALYLQEKM